MSRHRHSCATAPWAPDSAHAYDPFLVRTHVPGPAHCPGVRRHRCAVTIRLRRRAGGVHWWQSSPPSGSPRTGGAFLWALRARRLSHSTPHRVVVFLDYQNVYHRARDAFFPSDVAAREGQVDPLALGHLLTGRVRCSPAVAFGARGGHPSAPAVRSRLPHSRRSHGLHALRVSAGLELVVSYHSDDFAETQDAQSLLAAAAAPFVHRPSASSLW